MLQKYGEAAKTDDFDIHAAFVSDLLLLSDQETIRYHYDLLRDRSNVDLYLRLRLAMIKRGVNVVAFLERMTETEVNQEMRADLLHMLGRLRSPLGLILARAALTSNNPDTRHRGCYVIGWMGDLTDVSWLRSVLLSDGDDYVRRTAATSHSQMSERLPDLKDVLSNSLLEAVRSEQSLEVSKWVVVTLQYIQGKSFGLRENIKEGTVTGNVVTALEKVKAFFEGHA